MRAVRMRLRAEARTRWAAWLGLALLIGVVGGTAIAAAAGAQRTDSIVRRIVVAQRPPDVFVPPTFQTNGKLLVFDKIAKFPEVAEAVNVREILGSVEVSKTAGTERFVDVDMGVLPASLLNARRGTVLEGLVPSAEDPAAATVNFLARDRYGWHAGTTLVLKLVGPNADPFGNTPPPAGPTVRVRVAAVTSSLGDFSGGAQPGINLTEGFERTWGAKTSGFPLYVFRLRQGVKDSAAFQDHLRQLTHGCAVLVVQGQAGYDQARRSFHLYAQALRLLAWFLAIAAALVFGQTLARLTATESTDNPTMRALGLSVRDLTVLGVIRAECIAVAGGLMAIAVAYALSPLTPFGRPGLAEPTPGAHFAAGSIAIGAGAIVLATLMLAFVPAWRAARAHADTGALRPSKVAGWFGRVVARPSPAVGVRMALEPGRGASAVPVRSSLSSAILGIVALVVALSFAGNLQHLLATPALYGWNWDVVVSRDGGTFAPGSDDTRALERVAGVGSYAKGFTGEGQFFEIGDHVVEGLALHDVNGHVAPPLLSGRVPVHADEVAVGAKTLRATGRKLGERVSMRLLGTKQSFSMLVTGVVVLPFNSDQTALGEGVLLDTSAVPVFASAPALCQAGGGGAGPPAADTAFVRFAPGADRSHAVAALKQTFTVEDAAVHRPTAVIDLGRIRALPFVVLGIVAALSGGTIAHVLFSGVRRRRRDLAILKSLGFLRGQVRAAIAWQAATLAFVTALIGIPAGLGIGRWLWVAFASAGGFVSGVVVHPASLAVVAGSILALSLVVAALPAGSAARTEPAVVLRSE